MGDCKDFNFDVRLNVQVTAYGLQVGYFSSSNTMTYHPQKGHG